MACSKSHTISCSQACWGLSRPLWLLARTFPLQPASLPAPSHLPTGSWAVGAMWSGVVAHRALSESRRWWLTSDSIFHRIGQPPCRHALAPGLGVLGVPSLNGLQGLRGPWEWAQEGRIVHCYQVESAPLSSMIPGGRCWVSGFL